MLFVNCGLERHSFILFSRNINTVYILFVSFLDDMSHKLEIDVDNRVILDVNHLLFAFIISLSENFCKKNYDTDQK